MQAIIAKLGHTLSEVRIRALKNLLSKLSLGLVSVHDLVHERQLYVHLLQWFNQQDCSMVEEVLSLLLQLAKLPMGARSLVSCGGIAFFQAFRAHADPTWHKLIDDILTLLSSLPVELKEPLLVVEAGRTTAPIATTSLQPTTPDTLRTISRSPSSSLSPPLSYYSSSSTNPPRASAGSPATPRYFPALPLCPADEQLLLEVSVRLQLTDQPAVVLDALRAVREQLLEDFPPEVFAQHNDIWKQLLAIASRGAIHSEDDDLELTNRAVECLSVWAQKLLLSFAVHRDPYCLPATAVVSLVTRPSGATATRRCPLANADDPLVAMSQSTTVAVVPLLRHLRLAGEVLALLDAVVPLLPPPLPGNADWLARALAAADGAVKSFQRMRTPPPDWLVSEIVRSPAVSVLYRWGEALHAAGTGGQPLGDRLSHSVLHGRGLIDKLSHHEDEQLTAMTETLSEILRTATSDGDVATALSTAAWYCRVSPRAARCFVDCDWLPLAERWLAARPSPQSPLEDRVLEALFAVWTAVVAAMANAAFCGHIAVGLRAFLTIAKPALVPLLLLDAAETADGHSLNSNATRLSMSTRRGMAAFSRRAVQVAILRFVGAVVDSGDEVSAALIAGDDGLVSLLATRYVPHSGDHYLARLALHGLVGLVRYRSENPPQENALQRLAAQLVAVCCAEPAESFQRMHTARLAMLALRQLTAVAANGVVRAFTEYWQDPSTVLRWMAILQHREAWMRANALGTTANVIAAADSGVLRVWLSTSTDDVPHTVRSVVGCVLNQSECYEVRCEALGWLAAAADAISRQSGERSVTGPVFCEWLTKQSFFTELPHIVSCELHGAPPRFSERLMRLLGSAVRLCPRAVEGPLFEGALWGPLLQYADVAVYGRRYAAVMSAVFGAVCTPPCVWNAVVARWVHVAVVDMCMAACRVVELVSLVVEANPLALKYFVHNTSLLAVMTELLRAFPPSPVAIATAVLGDNELLVAGQASESDGGVLRRTNHSPATADAHARLLEAVLMTTAIVLYRNDDARQRLCMTSSESPAQPLYCGLLAAVDTTLRQFRNGYGRARLAAAQLLATLLESLPPMADTPDWPLERAASDNAEADQTLGESLCTSLCAMLEEHTAINSNYYSPAAHTARQQLSTAIRNLFAASVSAKRRALQRRFVPWLISRLRDVIALVAAESAANRSPPSDEAAKAGEAPAIHILWTDLSATLAILLVCLHGSPHAKTAAAEAGLSEALHRLVTLTPPPNTAAATPLSTPREPGKPGSIENLPCSKELLGVILNYCAHCHPAKLSLLSSDAASERSRNSPKCGVVPKLLALAKKPALPLELLELGFGCLQSLATTVEHRNYFLYKSNFVFWVVEQLKQRAARPSLLAKHSEAAAVTTLYLRFLLSVATVAEGQQALTKHTTNGSSTGGVLELMFELTENAKDPRVQAAAASLIAALSFLPANRTALAANDAYLTKLVAMLRADHTEPDECRLHAAVTIWVMVHGNIRLGSKLKRLGVAQALQAIAPATGDSPAAKAYQVAQMLGAHLNGRA